MMSENLKLLNIIKSFLLEYLPSQRGASQNTIKSYKESLNQLFNFLSQTLNLSISKITFDHLNKENILNYLDWIEVQC
jgi:site-specific recombinase XerD